MADDPLRILYLGNNRLGAQVLRHLAEEGVDEIVGLVLHGEDRRTHGDELLDAAGLPDERVFPGDGLRDDAVIERIAALDADLALSVLFDHILQPRFLDLFPRGGINLHPAYLPWNRGNYPNVWSILEGTPAGVTLHHMDEGVDTGDIIARREVPVHATDTGETLYRRLESAGLDLFRDTWPKVRADTADRIPQDPDEGCTHRRRDVDPLDRIDPDAPTTARELLDLLRARTFPPHPGAWFEDEHGRVYVRVSLLREDEL